MRDNPGAENSRTPNADVRRWQRLIAVALLTVGVVLAVSVFGVLRTREHDQIRRYLVQSSQDRTSTLERTLELDLLGLTALSAFFNGSNEVDRGEFQTFVSPLLQERSDIRAMLWAPRVPDSERTKFTTQAVRDGIPRFEIVESDSRGVLVPTSRRDEYFPVFFVEPAGKSISGMGFDLAVNPVCLEAMRRARDTGNPAATSKVESPHDPSRTVVQVFSPVYRRHATLTTVEDRRRNLKGFVAEVLCIESVVEESLAALTPMGIDIHLLDVSQTGRPKVLYLHQSRKSTSRAAPTEQETHAWQDLDGYSQTTDVAGRRWLIVCVASPEFIAARITWQPWLAAFGVLLPIAPLAWYLLEIARRSAKTARLVSQLAEANVHLKDEAEDRRKAEAILWTSEIKYKTLYDASGDAIILMTPDGEFLDGNPAAVALFAFANAKEFMFCNSADMSTKLQPDDTPSASKLFQNIAAAMRDGSCRFDWRFKRHDGTEFDAVVSLTKMVLEDEQFLLATIRDVTEQKRAEQERALTAQRIESMLALSHMADHPMDEIIATAVEDAICLTGSKIGYLALMNDDETVLTMQYMSKSVHAACKAIDKPIVYPMETTGLWGEAVRQRKPVVTNDYAAPNLLKRGTPEGHVPVVRHMNIPVFDGQRIIAVAGVGNKATDYDQNDVNQIQLLMDGWWRIASHKQFELKLAKAKEEAEEANRAKSRFLATMSHEIRTPMAAILGYADLLMDPTLGPSSRNNYAATIRRSGEHLLTLINDILDLSKIEAGKMTLDIRRCNIVSLMADVASLLRPRAEAKGVSLSVEYPGEMPETILTDGARLRQAIVNLAGNAIKFTEHGTVRLVAAFDPHAPDGKPTLRFDVIDTGIGIPPEVLPTLFQPFSQGDASVARKFGGTGLGLAISHHIAHLLGGNLTVQSVAGQGSTFTLVVPAGDLESVHMLQHPAEVEHETTEHIWQSAVEDLKGVRVLLAEDGYDNRELIQTILNKVGAIVETAENGRLAINKAESQSFDAILMDMNMPDIDGYQATSILRNHGYRGPILALTANAMAGDSERCLLAGCDEYLAKPINRAALIRTIAKHVGREASVALPETESNEPSPPCDTEVLISQYIDDPDIAPIIPNFIGRLDAQIERMRQAMDGNEFEELRRQSHSLKGAAGSYGYPTLTDACKMLEDAAKTQDLAAIGPALNEVASIIRAIHNGYASHASTGGVSA